MTKEQEGQKEGQASPHPRLETLNCQVHVVTLSQGSKPVQTATLVIVLEKLDKTLVQAVGEKLIPEHLVEYAFRPSQHHSRQEAEHIVMKHPPTLDPGAIANEDTLPNGQCAVVPHQQEVEESV